MDKVKFPIPILIVDDNPENLLVLSVVLRNHAYSIVEAKCGAEAVQLASEFEFAVILLDVMMPGMDGHETAFRIRKNPSSKNIPIIFVTAGLNDYTHVLDGYEAGAVDYLFKPLEPAIIKSKVAIFAELYSSKKEIERQAELIRIHDQQEHDSVLENAMDGVVGMNDLGKVIYWNRQAETIFGWKKSEVIGQNLIDFVIPEEYRDQHEKGMETFLRTGVGPILNKRIEIIGKRRNGNLFPVELSVTPILINGHYTFSAFIRDIEAKKKNEENLKAAIHARDEFISICSHELKTPVTSMKIQFQVARKLINEDSPKVFSRESVKKRIETANKQLDRMAKLIENMLDVSKIAQGKLIFETRPFDLIELSLDIIDSFREQLEFEGISFNLHYPKTHAYVFGDSHRIEQVISNLFSNAIKYGLKRPVDVSIYLKGDRAYFEIKDQGMGIEEKSIERIFDRYERAISSDISGLGLGLYVSQQIMAAHKGKLTVRSEIGKGSTFTMDLPLSRENPAVASSYNA